jgi:hypothetical protein
MRKLVVILNALVRDGQPWRAPQQPADTFPLTEGDQTYEGCTAPGFCATATNDAGDVAGAVVRDGFGQPWLRRASGEVLWLPYLAHHGCRPSAINSAGVIVGNARTDHGSHALIWTRLLP